MVPDPRLQALIVGFVAEAQELCARTTKNLLELESAALDEEQHAQSRDDVARMLHTLKGSAAMLGLDDLAELAHGLEDRFASFRDESGMLPREVADDLFAGLDTFMQKLRAAAGPPDAAPQPEQSSEASVPSLHTVTKRAEATSASAPTSETSASNNLAMWRVTAAHVVALTREVERLRDLRLRLDERRGRIVNMVSALDGLATARTRPEVAALRSSLLDLDRELRLDAEVGADIVDSLEEGVKVICTEPAVTMTEPLHRLVRDTCVAAGKEAALRVVGAELGLDRRLLDRLGGILAHLIRNAVDHGIEVPEERVRRGKHREGALVVRIEQQGNLVLVEVSDDGGGIDVERLREVAIERGLMSAEELAASSKRQLERLVFLPGLSTSRKLTATSGRGVGMDAVRETIEALGGQVEIESIPAQGTRFLLTAPAELGSSPVLLVRSSGHDIGVPMLVVERVVAVRSADLRGQRSAKLLHQDQLLRILDLGVVLGLRAPRAPLEGQPALIMAVHDERFALLVDDVVGDLDLVLRPLPAELRGLGAYQGVATVASGQPLPVVRGEWLAKSPDTVAPVQHRALVVDDSLTARAMHRAMLEAGGFAVHAVGDGATAMAQLRQARYEVVVCDVAMQGMTGLELAARVRDIPALAAQPLVLVSTHDAQVDRDKALSAGADAFLSKNECARGKLLDVVKDCIARRRGAA